jgi:hypothetical protein
VGMGEDTRLRQQLLVPLVVRRQAPMEMPELRQAQATTRDHAHSVAPRNELGRSSWPLATLLASL